jgi:hypothetical protein
MADKKVLRVRTGTGGYKNHISFKKMKITQPEEKHKQTQQLKSCQTRQQESELVQHIIYVQKLNTLSQNFYSPLLYCNLRLHINCASEL